MNTKRIGMVLILVTLLFAIYVAADFTLKTQSGYIVIDPADGNLYVDGNLVRYGANDFVIKSQASKDIHLDPDGGSLEVDGGGYFYKAGQLGVSSQRIYLGHNGSDGKITTATGDIRIAPAGGSTYVHGNLYYSGTLGSFDVFGNEYYDLELLNNITDNKGVWDLSHVVKRNATGHVVQRVTWTEEVPEVVFNKSGDEVLTGRMINITWVDNAQLSSYFIGVAKAQQKVIDNLTARIEALEKAR